MAIVYIFSAAAPANCTEGYLLVLPTQKVFPRSTSFPSGKTTFNLLAGAVSTTSGIISLDSNLSDTSLPKVRVKRSN